MKVTKQMVKQVLLQVIKDIDNNDLIFELEQDQDCEPGFELNDPDSNDFCDLADKVRAEIYKLLDT